ncbi:pyruvate dehydrogenase [Trinickia violacea]|uniref:Pyruvate dehydrogenase n=1 Tax=Trinickia violacea TaxID=2571746 RepID=A0A4P8IU27_9BURK|nr:alpha-ketoacid dehydrogenase subunit alpha/beta [Trinickia violacea]QCP50853.1 pyruvate dehydrogenase [Trinickia violacea]
MLRESEGSLLISTTKILEKALISRFVEESLLSLFSEGKLHGTVHTCIGQELVGSVISEFLLADDTIFSNHRCHGHFLSRHGDIEGLIGELMGRETGVSGGLGGSQHLYKDGFYSNGIQGGIVPVAAGLALGHKLRQHQNISVVFIGDGTLGEGVVYETFNIASKWELPLLIVLEDNKYSQSTSQEETLAGTIEGRAASFGIETIKANTWEPKELHTVAGNVIKNIRADSRPRLLHVETFRLKAHSKGDDTRPRSIVEPFEQRDPLNQFLANMSEAEAAWVDGLRQTVRDAIAKAERDPRASMSFEAGAPPLPSWTEASMPERSRVVSELNKVLDGMMSESDKVLIFGEDVLSPYGGAFKVTKGLSEKFPERVRNTPISEAAIVGIGVGLGLTEFRPIVEIMFGDFIGLAFDQIVNHAAKFQQMYNQQVSCNVIVRTPMGAGRGYGPTHSQSLDRHFFGVPGLRVLAMNHLTAPEQLYRPLGAQQCGPTLVIENKLLYGSYLMASPPEGYRLYHSDESFPTAWLRPDANEIDVTLLGYGGTSELLVKACELLFEEHDLIAQVISVMQVYPFSVSSIAERVAEAPCLLIVEEGQQFSGFGAEVISQLAENGQLADVSVGRLAPPPYCIPSSGPLEQEYLPDANSVVQAVLRMRAS